MESITTTETTGQFTWAVTTTMVPADTSAGSLTCEEFLRLPFVPKVTAELIPTSKPKRRASFSELIFGPKREKSSTRMRRASDPSPLSSATAASPKSSTSPSSPRPKTKATKFREPSPSSKPTLPQLSSTTPRRPCTFEEAYPITTSKRFVDPRLTIKFAPHPQLVAGRA